MDIKKKMSRRNYVKKSQLFEKILFSERNARKYSKSKIDFKNVCFEGLLFIK